ncbi:MAG: 2-hydroxyacyl-CoA dehydratase family protein [Deltaproteobacteria bacterium]|jgi:benzoyl-CoA reductase/2-hydroxyglutaryl-CoA dehydratase subunit BcrC/BadD/HgdB|nr:2-hydroxyacyl-CoA dehydratase family protein [Deltaproteobacteria bacterium]
MMYDYFKNMVDGVSQKLLQDPDSINAKKKYVLEIAKIGQKLYTRDEKIAWCGVTIPFDLLNSMGVTSCFVEFVGAMLSSNETAPIFIKEAEDSGYAPDSCAYHRAVTGAMLKDIMPEPDFIIGSSSPCTAGLAVMEDMARRFKKDFFILNVPQNNSKESIKFLTDQIKEMTRFITAHTQKPLSMEKLGRALEFFNESSLILKDIYNLAKQTPSPVDNKLLKDFGTVIGLIMGTREGVEICQAFKDELIDRIESQKIDPSKEKIRIMWIQNRIQYKFPIEKMLEDFGVKIVVDELNDVTWEPMDPDNPFESIAKRIISIPYSLGTNERIAHMQLLAREYKLDGAINPCHWGCRQGTGVRGLTTRGLKDVNVPVLNLEIDCVDSRNLAQGQIETRLEAFVEMLT